MLVLDSGCTIVISRQKTYSMSIFIRPISLYLVRVKRLKSISSFRLRICQIYAEQGKEVKGIISLRGAIAKNRGRKVGFTGREDSRREVKYILRGKHDKQGAILVGY